jgi:non-specific serine/threonine protein kinase
MTNQNSQEILEAILQPDGLVLEWKPNKKKYSEVSFRLQQETFRLFNASVTPEWLFHLGFSPTKVELPEALDYWRRIAATFTKKLALTPNLEELRQQATVDITNEQLQDFYLNAPLFQGEDYLTTNYLHQIWQSLTTTFQRLIKSYKGTVEEFLHSHRPNLELAGRIFFHLVENKKGASAPFAFLATYSTRTGQDGTTRHVPLKNALKEYEGDKNKLLSLLSTVYRAAKQSSFITKLLESGRIFHPLSLSETHALVFLKEVPAYEDAGICCRIPNWWKSKATKVTISISIGDKKPSTLGFEALINCSPQLTIDGTLISHKEAQALLAETHGLALIKNRWVEVDREQLQKTLEAYENAQTLLDDGLSIREAMRLLLNPGAIQDATEMTTEITFGNWFADIAQKLQNPQLVRQKKPNSNFKASLRPYQQLGLNWLTLLDSLNFGACLADDMGLGKTIQVLAFLSTVCKSKSHPSLLILPASLLGNWRDEIERFYPSLKHYILHSSAIGTKSRKQLSETELKNYELIITTYGMAQRSEWLHNHHWHYVILDEAQAIKNPGTRQSRAVKKLKCINRLALTGTPVENRLADLWSLFDFLNPGLLGSNSEFKKIARNIQSSENGYSRLRKVITPYILRRLKTDKTIISDLPDKVEMKTYSTLSKKQVIIYQDLVGELKKSLEDLDGIQRRGLILASLMKFKQICNHPAQYTGSKDFTPNDSGKFLRLKEVCETIYAKRERVLVFTQFQEMTDALNDFLTNTFQHPGLVIHGSIPVKKRQALVNSFQNSRDYIPYMVLSVKAAGVGLNLTRANHVIHFDRWWNPAVENQATDRAFRIGQSRNVIVHKFVTKGTIEEKIDQMLQAKTTLSEQIVSASGENWITEMSNTELTELFTLSL